MKICTYRLVRALAVASLLLGSAAAHALVVTVGDTGDIATAILNLDVNGTRFNVNFEFGTADQIYGTSPPAFNVDNVGDADAVKNAVLAELEAFPSGEIILVGNEVDNSNVFLIPYSASAGVVTASAGGYDVSEWVDLGNQTRFSNVEQVYATFSVVPVPAAAWLFATALGLLGWTRRRRMI